MVKAARVRRARASALRAATARLAAAHDAAASRDARSRRIRTAERDVDQALRSRDQFHESMREAGAAAGHALRRLLNEGFTAVDWAVLVRLSRCQVNFRPRPIAASVHAPGRSAASHPTGRRNVTVLRSSAMPAAPVRSVTRTVTNSVVTSEVRDGVAAE
jgi:hypothetical protein